MIRLGWTGEGTRERATARIGPGGVTLAGRIAAQGWSGAYRITAGAGWQAERLSVRLDDGRALDLRRAEGWAPGCGGCTDPDLSASPVTNTLPIRRLGLGIGERAEIAAMFVAFPDLTVFPARQRYTRLADRVWRYEGLDTGFTRDIAVDADGFVTEYPGLFTRDPAERGAA